MAKFDRIFKNAHVVNHDGTYAADIAVKDGKVAQIGDFTEDATEVLDCKGLHILPGVIDTQVHFREPGLEHKEDLESGSLSAVMGGVTGVFEMPNTSPLTVTKEAFNDKIERATHRMHCDFAFYFGGTHDNVDLLADMERENGCAGIKVFMGSSTGDLLVADDDGVEAILNAVNRRAAFHSEDEYRLEARKGERVEGDPSSHPVWRDAQAAVQCTQRLLALAEKTGKQIHVLHISTADEMEILAEHKHVASVEVTPHHLTLEASLYETLGTRIQMNPPVREAAHRDGIWRGVEQGIADILGSDHAPHTLAEKDQTYPYSPSGMTGVQTLVPIMLDHINQGKMSLERFVDMTSAGPQRLFGLANKGRIAVGYDADFTIVDMNRQTTITNDWVKSKAGWTPYDGKKVTGWPVGTIVRGKKVMWEGALEEANLGEPITFHATRKN